MSLSDALKVQNGALPCPTWLLNPTPAHLMVVNLSWPTRPQVKPTPPKAKTFRRTKVNA